MNTGRVRLVALVLVGILVLVTVMNSFMVVETGTRGVVKTFGEVTAVYGEGLHFRPPFITQIETVDVRTQRFTSQSTAASKDLQFVTAEVVLNYRVDSTAVGDLVTEIGSDYENKVIDPAIQESVKAATAQYTAEQLVTLRPQVSDSIRNVLIERLTARHIVVEDLAITDFRFSEEFSRAIESKQVAEQEALRAERELQRVQIEAQQQVAQAEAEAEANIALAQAEAESLRLLRESLTPELLQLRFIEKWNGVLPRITSGDGNGGFGLLLQVPTDEVIGDSTAPAPAPLPEPAPEPEN